jgi:hypothetical protein
VGGKERLDLPAQRAVGSTARVEKAPAFPLRELECIEKDRLHELAIG